MGTLFYRDPATQDFAPVAGGGPPIGVIIPYTGATAPPGWAICDGAAHGSAELEAVTGFPTTPDLRGRFVVAAGATMPVRQVGGEISVTLTAAQTAAPAHTHSGSLSSVVDNHTHNFTTSTDGGHTHGGTYVSNYIYAANMSDSRSGQWIGENTGKSGSVTHNGGTHTHAADTSGYQNAAHSHGVTINANAAADAVVGHNNLPPYYAMVYIIRAF